MSIIDTVQPYTMMPVARLEALAELVRDAPAEYDGAIVQCGVWNGGSAALIAQAVLPPRDVWLFDSFQGLPKPGMKDGAKAQSKYVHVGPGWCQGSEEQVRDVFAAIGWPEKLLHIIPGWLADTMSTVKIRPIAVLHIDVDFYDATKAVLERFADLVAGGGILIVDDYGHWEGARRACDEFMPTPGNVLLPDDPTRYWRAIDCCFERQEFGRCRCAFRGWE